MRDELRLEKIVTSHAKNRSPINSSRYKIELDKPILGRGNWGTIYPAIDTELNFALAIKVFDPTLDALMQMKYRNLTPEDSIKKDVPGMFGYGTNLVHHMMEFDDDGKPFVIMPIYDEDLKKYLSEDINIKNYWTNQNGKVKEKYDVGLFSKVVKQMIKGVSDFHSEYKKAHGDLKWENWLVKFLEEKSPFSGRYGGEVKIDLNDYGCSSDDADNVKGPRDNMGDRYSRAPETFKKGFEPDFKADFYQLTNCIYKIITGESLLEHELNNAKDIEQYMLDLDKDIHETLKKKKVKALPKEFKAFEKLFNKGLSYDPKDRFVDDKEFQAVFEKAVNDSDSYGVFKRQLRKVVLPIVAATGGLLLLTYAAQQAPEELAVPDVNMHGPVYGELKMENKIVFERDTIIDYTKASEGIRLMRDNDLNMYTHNAFAAYMLRYYDATSQALYGKDRRNYFTDFQMEYSSAYKYAHGISGISTRGIDGEVALAIEFGLSKAATSDENGNSIVDLEDACAIARLGQEEIYKAAKEANSFDYKDYKNYLSQEEVKFIDAWLGHLDINALNGGMSK